MTNSIIINNSLKVNAFKNIFTNSFKSNALFTQNDKQDDLDLYKQDDFLTNDDILEMSNEIDKQDEKDNLFYSLVPKIHQSTVRNLVKKQFNNVLNDYIKTIPLFFEPLIWSKKKKDECDEKFLTNKSNRDKKIYKKGLILHSAQLLKLIGFGRQKVSTVGMVKEYVEDMENSDDYINKLRLINSKGKIIKLETNKEKQFKKLARMNKIADTMDLIAKDKGFTNSMITLTLPPCFHPNPKNNNCSYNGASPGQAKKQLMIFWQALRSMLSNNGFIFGENLIGLQVIELQLDSTLHLHSIFYHSKADEELLTECLHSVEDNYNKKQTDKSYKLGSIDKNGKYKRGFDISYSNQKQGDDTYQSGASYLMKYLYKTHTTYDDQNPDDSVLKNQAGRFFYGIRSFNFFGYNGALTKFEFLVKNWKTYENALTDEIKNCLKTRDLYSFITHYKDFFDNEYNKDSSTKRFIGVRFDRKLYKQSVNNEKQEKLVLELFARIQKEINILKSKIDKAILINDIKRIETLNKVITRKLATLDSLNLTDEVIQDKIDDALSDFDMVLIEKKIFSIFQSTEQTEQLESISTIDLDLLINLNVKQSYDCVLEKQDELDFMVNFSKEHYKEQGISVLTLSLLNVINLTLNKSINNKKPVQLIQSLSSGNFKPSCFEKELKNQEIEQILEQIHFETWLEQREIFNY